MDVVSLERWVIAALDVARSLIASPGDIGLTIQQPERVVYTSAEPDSYRLGCRYRHTTGPDGERILEIRPIRPEDLLHPEEGDEFAMTEQHGRIMTYLRNAFTALVAHIAHAYVLFDVNLQWDEPGLRP